MSLRSSLNKLSNAERKVVCAECSEKAIMGIKNERPTHCLLHKKENMVRSNKRYCVEINCNTRATYAETGQTTLTKCTKHKSKGMKALHKASCAYVDESGNQCETRPNFNYALEKCGLYCKKHKLENMVDVVNTKCAEPGCCVQPRYNFATETTGKFCFTHKKQDMIDVVNPKCAEPGCLCQPRYNFPTESTRKYCTTHKHPGMTEVTSARCCFANCVNKALYAVLCSDMTLSDEIYCAEHRKPEMKAIKRRECKFEDCFVGATYGYPGGTREYCVTHKLPNMIDVVHKTCEEESCLVRPNFNFPGEKIGRCCKKHAEPGMIDVLHSYCIVDECKHRPSFGNPSTGEITHCALHKSNEMEDLCHKKCKTPYCEIVASQAKYRGYCMRCFMYTFPDEPVVRNYKTKERHVAEYLQSHFPEADWVFDKTMQNDCLVRNRPDIMCDFGSHVLVVEVDEYQHGGYDNSCENARIMKIWLACQPNCLVTTTTSEETITENKTIDYMYNDFPDYNSSSAASCTNKPLVFIRFNPDGYVDEMGDRVSSCWSTNNSAGVCEIVREKRHEWNNRLQCLKETVMLYSNIDNIGQKMVKVDSLYFS